MTSDAIASGETRNEDATTSSESSEAQPAKVSTRSESSDTDSSTITSYFVLVGNQGCQLLMRRDKDRFHCTHKIRVQHSSYEGAQLTRQEICSHFGISAHTYITAKAELDGETENYCFLLTLVEVTEKCKVTDPFEWAAWQCYENFFDHACPHPHIARFLKSYLSNMDVEEINLRPTPWKRVGFYSMALPRIREIMSNAGYEMHGRPEQVHFGSLSSIFKIPTNRGFVFFKAGFKGNGELQKTKAVTNIFPEDTPRLLAVDHELEAMISEDHGPSVHKLYIVKSSERPELGECETKCLFVAALTQWARIQKESIDRVQELVDSGIPVYDMSWIRAGFSELVSYMKQAELDGEYEKVVNFEKNMEKTFEVWERLSIPDTLVHGDLHNSNIAQPGGLGTKFIFFDLDSAFVGHPFLELYSDETEEVTLGEEAYLECWKEYGEYESLQKLALWTTPVRYVIEALRVSRKEIWTDVQRKMWVQYNLDKLMDALDKCDYNEDWC